jgi:hypothetical protein
MSRARIHLANKESRTRKTLVLKNQERGKPCPLKEHCRLFSFLILSRFLVLSLTNSESISDPTINLLKPTESCKQFPLQIKAWFSDQFTSRCEWHPGSALQKAAEAWKEEWHRE